jgi:hypothetical protein
MDGKAFLPSAMRAFGLITRNLGRVAVVSMVGNIVVTVGTTQTNMSRNIWTRLIYVHICTYREACCHICMCRLGLFVHELLHAG